MRNKRLILVLGVFVLLGLALLFWWSRADGQIFRMNSKRFDKVVIVRTGSGINPEYGHQSAGVTRRDVIDQLVEGFNTAVVLRTERGGVDPGGYMSFIFFRGDWQVKQIDLCSIGGEPCVWKTGQYYSVLSFPVFDPRDFFGLPDV